MTIKTDRRRFLQSALIGGFSVWAGGRAWGQENKSPNSRISFACIGVGGKGDSDTADANTYGNVVAICDVDSKTLDSAGAKYPRSCRSSGVTLMFFVSRRNTMPVLFPPPTPIGGGVIRVFPLSKSSITPLTGSAKFASC